MHASSGLEAVGRAVLLKPYSAERLSSIIAIPDSIKMTTMLLEQKAVVLEVGPSCWSDEMGPRCAAGDHVIITKAAGYIAQGEDGETYRLVNDRDVFAKVAPPKESSND